VRPEAGPDRRGVDPFVAVVMDEMGLDVTGHKPKSFAQLEDDSFDVVISLTPEAQHRAVELARDRATDIEYWPTHDPPLRTARATPCWRPIARCATLWPRRFDNVSARHRRLGGECAIHPASRRDALPTQSSRGFTGMA
jgi:hypothetical protein